MANKGEWRIAGGSYEGSYKIVTGDFHEGDYRIIAEDIFNKDDAEFIVNIRNEYDKLRKENDELRKYLNLEEVWREYYADQSNRLVDEFILGRGDSNDESITASKRLASERYFGLEHENIYALPTG